MRPGPHPSRCGLRPLLRMRGDRVTVSCAWIAPADVGVTLSMRDLRFQRFMNVVALPTRLLVIDLHVEGERELACRKCRIEIGGQRLEDVVAGLLAGSEIAALAKPEHHVEKAVGRIAVGDRIVLAPDGADPDAAERKDAGLD